MDISVVVELFKEKIIGPDSAREKAVSIGEKKINLQEVFPPILVPKILENEASFLDGVKKYIRPRTQEMFPLVFISTEGGIFLVIRGLDWNFTS